MNVSLPAPRRRRQIARAGLLAAVAVVVLPAALGPSSTPHAEADVAVRVHDDEFAPDAIVIEVGETVTWAWTGRNPHSVAGGPWGTSHPGCSPLTTGACGTSGSTFSWTASATDVGTIGYSCQVHGGAMIGRIVVVEPGTEPSPSPTPSSSPSASPSPSPSSSPSATPSPTSSPTPTPGPAASPTFGPPPARATAPPVAVEPTGTDDPGPAPAPVVTLEPFPAPVDPESATQPAIEEDSAAATTAARQAQPRPVTARVLAAGLVAGTMLAIVQFVLFGPPWVGRDERQDVD